MAYEEIITTGTLTQMRENGDTIARTLGVVGKDDVDISDKRCVEPRGALSVNRIFLGGDNKELGAAGRGTIKTAVNHALELETWKKDLTEPFELNYSVYLKWNNADSRCNFYMDNGSSGDTNRYPVSVSGCPDLVAYGNNNTGFAIPLENDGTILEVIFYCPSNSLFCKTLVVKANSSIYVKDTVKSSNFDSDTAISFSYSNNNTILNISWKSSLWISYSAVKYHGYTEV